jgi:hypothetical protein
VSEWRTQEQIEADELLHVAIAGVLMAYSDDPDTDEQFMLTEYIVISARVGMTPVKAQSTRYDYTLANGSIPWHNMMGLMDWARMVMKDVMEGKREDE